MNEETPWRDYLLFYEYFHGNDRSGLGAGRQTGWTGLVGKHFFAQFSPSPISEVS